MVAGLAPRRKSGFPNVSKRLVSAISAFPETRAVVSLRRLATHYQVCNGSPEGPRVPLHLISIHLNPLVQKCSILTVVRSGPLWPPARSLKGGRRLKTVLG